MRSAQSKDGLAQIVARARGENRAAFIPYVMAGDPDLPTTALILNALCDAGADAIELGIPYGDPLADGPTIAAAGARSLARGTKIADVFALVNGIRERGVPLVLFTYFNPVYQYGVERFAQNAAAAGCICCWRILSIRTQRLRGRAAWDSATFGSASKRATEKKRLCGAPRRKNAFGWL